MGTMYTMSDNFEVHLGTYKYTENIMFFEK